MNLFKKKCEYCKEKVEKGKELLRDVKNPIFVGSKQKTFCCLEHADFYEQKINEHIKNSKCKRSCY